MKIILCREGVCIPPKCPVVDVQEDQVVIGEKDNMVSGTAISVPLSEVDGISEYQIIQENRRDIKILIKKSDKYSPNANKQITEIMQLYLGKDIKVHIEVVKEILSTIRYRATNHSAESNIDPAFIVLSIDLYSKDEKHHIYTFMAVCANLTRNFIRYLKSDFRFTLSYRSRYFRIF